MGNCAGQKEVKLVLIGLDMAGKTSLLNRLCHSDAGTTTPTVGFNFESTMYKNVRVSFWDTGGQDKIRDLWKHYYEEVSKVIFKGYSKFCDCVRCIRKSTKCIKETFFEIDTFGPSNEYFAVPKFKQKNQNFLDFFLHF